MRPNNKYVNRVVSLPIIFIIILGSFAFWQPRPALAANAGLSLGPSTGTFVVDSTFDVSIFLDTAGQSVNAVELGIKFPPDKLQLVSSSTGKSIIGIWPSLPKFNNQTGTIQLVGGIPNGTVVSKGLISTLTFRAKAIGSAVVKIDQSKVLSNDGSGTEIAVSTSNSLFQIILPPPAGPVIVSDTHPDQNIWYKEKNVSLRWGDEGGVEGFSYMISDIAVDLPDDISEGTAQSIVYKNVSDGRHYFHIKGLRNGQWGGVSHYPLNIDSVAPASFKIEIIPRPRTTRRQPVIQFQSTDATSGVDHYELKLLPLQNNSTDKSLSQPLFIEATSPFVTAELENGGYDVIVRAFDKAQNFTEEKTRIDIVPALLRNIGEDGLELRSNFVLPWMWVWIILILIFLLLLLIAYLIRRHHHRVHAQVVQPQIPEQLQEQLSQLQRYRDKYGNVVILFLVLSLSWFASFEAKAQTQVLTPPLIKTINKNLSNDELFYAGGFTGIPKAEVVLFLQNLESGETLQFNIPSDADGEWFYRHNEFLSPGDYLLWGQSKISSQLSPPSAQITLTVEKKALQFGATRFSQATLYLLAIIILLLILLSIVAYIIYHYHKIRKKNKLIAKQIVEIEASIRRGFAVLNRDIQAELELLKRSKGHLSQADLQKEEQLLRDLDEIEQYLSKEIWELEETERI